MSFVFFLFCHFVHLPVQVTWRSLIHTIFLTSRWNKRATWCSVICAAKIVVDRGFNLVLFLSFCHLPMQVMWRVSDGWLSSDVARSCGLTDQKFHQLASVALDHQIDDQKCSNFEC